MAKKINWEYSEPELDFETGEETGNILTHTISLCYSYVSGKAIVTIDGTEFDISTRPLGLRGTSQVFRLGDTPAILDFPKKGDPAVIVDGERL